MRKTGQHVKAIAYQTQFERRLARLAAEKERKKALEATKPTRNSLR